MKSSLEGCRRAIARDIRDARRAAGLTQGELAKRLRRPPSYVSRAERGIQSLSVAEFVDFARALRLDPGELLSRALKNA